ncbi:RHS repeat protein [Pseudoduganella namucuonensis]|uniref:YD repeat-containing protein n=1 Tax=Pseudoduganella namucuonensis TaxID=1035707 RepID=A0A1I7L456_9BURK|nr:RHS repeat protein [Pseudoduganella namucuonensis]SFV04491.1 YD repeat-containing protein [Pseudoduganella namucuonensis]
MPFTFANCINTPNGDCIPASATYTDEDGTKYVYKYIGWTDEANRYTYAVNGAAATGELIFTYGSSWRLFHNKKTQTYTNGGYIQSATDVTGAVLTFSYLDGTKVGRVTNPAGQFIQLTYGGNGRVSTVRDTAGGIWTYAYNGAGMLVKVTSPGTAPDIREYLYEAADGTLLTGLKINGQRYSRYSYYADRRVKESGLESGEEKETFEYGANQTKVTDLRGQPVTYGFVPIQGALKISSVSRAATGTCAAASARTVYDGLGYVDYTLDWNGNKTDYTFDVAGKLVSVTNAANTAHAATMAHTWSGDEIVQTEFRGAGNTAYAKVNYAYQAGLIKSETWTDLKSSATRQLIYGYTTYPNNTIATRTVTRVLPEGNVTATIKYDTLGNIVSTTNYLGQQQSWSNHNALGLAGRHIDLNGIATDFGYDPKGNLIRQTQHLPNGDRVTTFTYNNNRQLTDVSYADGRVDRYRYNISGRLEKIGDAAQRFATLALDVPKNTYRKSSERRTPGTGSVPVIVPDGQFSSTTVLDSLGRPYTDIGNHGQRIDYRYDGNGNLKSRTDAAGHVTRFNYDAQNRLILRIAPDGGETRWHYNPEGQLQFVQDPRGLRTNYTYNGFGDVTSAASPDTGLTTYQYDAIGRLASSTTADGKMVQYGFDSLDRPTYRFSGNVTESFTYDKGAYGKGRLTSVDDATGRTTFDYTAAGELRSKVSNILGQTYALNWSYDSAGRLLGFSDPSGMSIGYDHDGIGNLTRVRSSLAGWGVLADSFQYQPVSGLRYAWRFGNGLPRLVTLDTDGRVTRLAGLGAHNQAFDYTNVDTTQSITDYVYPMLNETLRYDAADRLATVAKQNDPQGFAWDKAGNRIDHTRAGISYPTTVDALSNRLLSWRGGGKSRNFTYNKVGDLWMETGSKMALASMNMTPSTAWLVSTSTVRVLGSTATMHLISVHISRLPQARPIFMVRKGNCLWKSGVKRQATSGWEVSCWEWCAAASSTLAITTGRAVRARLPMWRAGWSGGQTTRCSIGALRQTT